MASVFKKLISKELGEYNYYKYFLVCQKSLQNKILDSKEIYNDIYENLKRRDRKTIRKMHKRLNDSMILVIRISKTYFFSLLFLIGAIIFILSRNLDSFITIVSIISMIIIFIVKTYEFLINKYCFIDAHIVLVYKTVLDRILLINDLENFKNSNKD